MFHHYFYTNSVWSFDLLTAFAKVCVLFTVSVSSAGKGDPGIAVEIIKENKH